MMTVTSSSTGRTSSVIRAAIVGVLRHAGARRAAFRVAATRGRSLVLVYHRLAPEGVAPHEVVPSLSNAIFRRQLEILGEVGDIVPLAKLLAPPESRRRVRFAITFDDDYLSHHRHALPLLQRLGVHGTFFLSGRSFRGLGPYWWVLLEQTIAEQGIEETRRMLGICGDTPSQLAAACERREMTERLSLLVVARESPGLEPSAIRALAGAGMTIGFHTLHHPVLTHLSHEDIDRALLDGREELAAAIGRPVELFAYPHGRADRRVARRVRVAGYRAAFVTGGRPIGLGSDIFRLGRWEAGQLTDDELLAHLALRLNYPIAVPPR
jgi:peptidoglycan/xylan/chitin deacetylase (PgdA/CDA1 family)